MGSRGDGGVLEGTLEDGQRDFENWGHYAAPLYTVWYMNMSEQTFKEQV